MPDYYIINNDKIENIITAETEKIAKDITDAEEVLLRNYEALYDIGWIKNTDLDKWYNPVAPYPSWTLDSNLIWQPPSEKPDGDYYWDEENTEWVEIDDNEQ